MDIIYIIIGFIVIIIGANGLTDGAASIAKRLKVSSLVIGLTIVGFGTSTPELTVSLVSAMKGSADLSVGNIVGSNIFNALFIVGCTALFAPIVITKNTLRREIPLSILAAIVLLICSNDIILNHESSNVISRTDGLIMLCFFIIFIGYSLAIARNGNGEEEHSEIKQLSWLKSTIYIIVGLAALVFGGQILVTGAVGIARSWGISESIIGVTIVAVGTSLPELATSIVAALKKNPEIAIGNVIGSNLFNIFFILGCSATITPLRLQGITNFDMIWLVASAVLLWFFGLFFGKRIIMRFEGTILILAWVAYTVLLIIRI